MFPVRFSEAPLGCSSDRSVVICAPEGSSLLRLLKLGTSFPLLFACVCVCVFEAFAFAIPNFTACVFGLAHAYRVHVGGARAVLSVCCTLVCVSVCSSTAPPRLRLNHPFVSQVLKRRSGTLLLLLLRTPLSREVMQLVICSEPSSRLILGAPPSRPIYLTYPK